jgi:hypothetical protein
VLTKTELIRGCIARCQWLTPIILATQEAEIKRIEVRSQPEQIVLKTLSRKYPTQKKAGEVAQVVECLLSKHKAKFKTPGPPKNKRIKECIHYAYQSAWSVG